MELMNDHEVLTIRELAEMLRVGKNRAYELVNVKAIPSFKIGSSIRVYRVAVIRWLERQSALDSGEETADNPY